MTKGLHLLSPQDFLSYYIDSYIKLEDKAVAYVVGTDGGTGVIFRRARDREQVVIPLQSLCWEQFRPPSFGYRNLSSGCKNLCYFQRIAGRIRYKGTSRHTVAINPVPEIIPVMRELGLSTDRYDDTLTFTEKAAYVLFNPMFYSVDNAVKTLAHSPLAVGAAISPDFAIVLGINRHNAFILLWKEVPVAHSTTGEAWRVLNNEYRGIIERDLRGLKYAA